MTAPLLVVVGRVGRAHGVRGDVAVEVRTDDPERRFVPGARLLTSSASASAPSVVTVEHARWHSGRLLLHLVGVEDRTSAESLRGLLLQVEVDPDETPADPEEFYDHQLVGLAVVDPAGTSVGSVVDVVHGAQDLLVIEHGATGSRAQRSLVPFVRMLVPEVDLDAGRLVVDLPDGLLDLPAE
jgi:16S rRNA processing protein RimM